MPAREPGGQLSCRGDAAELRLIADRIARLSQDTRAVHPALTVAALAARENAAAAVLADALRAHQVEAWHKRRQLRARLLRLLGARPDLLPPIARLPELDPLRAGDAPSWLVDLRWLTRRRSPLYRFGVQLDLDVEQRHWVGRVVAGDGAPAITVNLPAWWPASASSASGRSGGPPTVAP